VISFMVPIRTVNESNGGGNSRHRFAIASRRKAHKQAVALAWAESHQPVPSVPCAVRMVRLSAGELDDDGLRSALKSVRDAVAAMLEVDDGPRGPITWAYAQERCRRGEYAVRVEFRPPPVKYTDVLAYVERELVAAYEAEDLAEALRHVDAALASIRAIPAAA
jgi:hypothetical protein